MIHAIDAERCRLFQRKDFVCRCMSAAYKVHVECCNLFISMMEWLEQNVRTLENNLKKYHYLRADFSIHHSH